MSLKRRILPRVRKSEANSAPVPMKVITLPDKAKGLRVNCPGFSIVITRKLEGGAKVSVVAAKDGKHIFRCSLLFGRHPDRDSVVGDSVLCNHPDLTLWQDRTVCDDCGATKP